MKKYQATESFKELGIDNNYQGLETEQYFALMRGEAIELKHVPIHLIDGKFIQEVKQEFKDTKGVKNNG